MVTVILPLEIRAKNHHESLVDRDTRRSSRTSEVPVSPPELTLYGPVVLQNTVDSCRVLPNLNASYLPVMPDGCVLLLDDVCHHSGDVPVGAFCCLAGATSPCPCALSALEEQNFLFQLASDRPPEDACKGLEVLLVAVIQWSTPKLPFTSSIYTHYRLPSIRLEGPRFVMTATCETPVCPCQRFTITYTLLNELQDFLAVRLVWMPKTATAGGDSGDMQGTNPPGGQGGDKRGPRIRGFAMVAAGICGRRPGGEQCPCCVTTRLVVTAGKKLSGDEHCATQPTLDAIVYTLINNLGFSCKGSALTIRVAFQALCTGLFEVTNRGHCGEVAQCPRCPQLSQHVKLKLQFAEARARCGRCHGGADPAVRELVERHQAGLGRSQSSHQQPARGHLMRWGGDSGERPFVPTGQAAPPSTAPSPCRWHPLYLPPDRMALALDKIANRVCKALVVEPAK
ncbi:LOW QUALITY PROTEIN: trafficking protein particle complex subunit 14-like [Pterocles gutturalis]